MRTITIELSKSSIKDALRELRSFRDAQNKTLNQKLEEVCRILVQIGAEEARRHLSYNYGNNDVVIIPTKTDGGWKLTMSGHDVYFIEFGTGDYAGEYPGDTTNVSVGTMPGDWSDTHSRQYSEHGFWYWHNLRFTGTPAEMPMYWAGKAIRENVDRVVQEVFSK